MTYLESPNVSPDIASDLLLGAEAIAEFLYGSKQARGKVYHLRRSSNVPIGYLGSQLCARRSRLTEWIKAQEDKNANKQPETKKKNGAPEDDGQGSA